MLATPPSARLFPYTTLFRSTHDHLIDLFGVDAGAAGGFGDDGGSEVGGGDIREGAIEAADGRANTARDDDVFHVQCVLSACSKRSEEHTSELQSRENLVCRL